MGRGSETKNVLIQDQKSCIRGREDFQYLEVKMIKENRQNIINKGRAITAMINDVLSN